MKTSYLKLQILKQIVLLDNKLLCEFSGILSNLMHGQYGVSDWENLSIEEKDGIRDSIKQLDKNGGIPHETVIKKIQEKFKKCIRRLFGLQAQKKIDYELIITI